LRKNQNEPEGALGQEKNAWTSVSSECKKGGKKWAVLKKKLQNDWKLPRSGKRLFVYRF
jgi:hypothetical protein